MTVSLYRRYRAALKDPPFDGKFMPYNWSPLPPNVCPEWLPYAMMLDEFSRGLANVINELTHHERRLRAWSVVVAPLTDVQKMAATHEFIGAIGIVAVNLPYVIRNRPPRAPSETSAQPRPNAEPLNPVHFFGGRS